VTALALLERLSALPKHQPTDTALQDARDSVRSALWHWDQVSLAAATSAADYLSLQTAPLETIALMVIRRALG
jgi:hypothetical protein